MILSIVGTPVPWPRCIDTSHNHLILFAYLEEPIRSLIELRLTHNKAAVILLAGLLIFLLSLAAAYLSFNLYEKRFLRLKRFFDYRAHPNTAD